MEEQIEEKTKSSIAYGKLGFILGIIAVIFGFGFIFPVSVASLVCSLIGYDKKEEPTWQTILGIVLGVISTALGIAIFSIVAFIVLFSIAP